jgi:hypothetical protein
MPSPRCALWWPCHGSERSPFAWHSLPGGPTVPPTPPPVSQPSCGPGYLCNAGIAAPCPAGTYNAAGEVTECQPIPPGRYDMTPRCDWLHPPTFAGHDWLTARPPPGASLSLSCPATARGTPTRRRTAADARPSPRARAATHVPMATARPAARATTPALRDPRSMCGASIIGGSCGWLAMAHCVWRRGDYRMTNHGVRALPSPPLAGARRSRRTRAAPAGATTRARASSPRTSSSRYSMERAPIRPQAQTRTIRRAKVTQ